MAETTTVKAGGAAADAKPDQLSGNAAIMSGRVSMMRTVYGGTETLRAAADTYLPQYERETDERYQSRLASTFALNKLKEAVEAASAKPFRTLIKVVGTDPDLDLWIKNVDLRGTHMHLFAHQFFNDALLTGQSHVLVDHPDTYQLPNLAAQKAANARPFLKHIKDDQLIAAYTDYSGGEVKVVHARIRGQRKSWDASYKEVIVNQIFVIEVDPGTENGVVQIYEQGGEGGQWARVSESRIKMREVPLVTMYGGEQEDDFLSKSIFQDLAYKQIEHWISSSDQRSILAAGRFPMLAASGVQLDENDEEGFAIGPYKVLTSPDPQGRWYYVEPTGKAIESGFKDLAMLEMQMDMMALNPVIATHRQYVPQNERDIAETRVHSVVHDLAMDCKKAMERAIGFMGMWNGKEEQYREKVSVDLNMDFSNTKDKLAEVAQLFKMYEKRGISRETLLREARARDLLNDEFDIAQELSALEALDAQDLAMQNASGKPGETKTPAPAPQPTDFPTGSERPTRQI